MPKRSNHAMRNLRSSGKSIAKHTVRATAKSAEGIFRWAATDHAHIGQAMQNNPYTEPADRVGYIATLFFISIVGAVLQGIWIVLLVAYGIPLFLTGHF